MGADPVASLLLLATLDGQSPWRLLRGQERALRLLLRFLPEPPGSHEAAPAPVPAPAQPGADPVADTAAAPPAPPPPPLVERLRGVVKSFNSANGFGFISCEEVQRRFNADVFLHRSEVDISGATVGAVVSFSLRLNSQGKPQAAGVAVEAQVVPGAAVAAAPPKRYEGLIKSLSEAQGFGFITCEETSALFGRDVFLHKAQANGFRVGDRVSFAVDIEPTRGFPQARALVLAVGAAGAGPAEGSPTSPSAWLQLAGGAPPAGSPQPGQGAAGQQPRSSAHRGADQVAVEVPGGRFRGVIKSFNSSSGFGFIACEELRQAHGRDVFLHTSQVGSFHIGDAVSFRVERHPVSGHPQAKDLEDATGGAAKVPPPPPATAPQPRRAADWLSGSLPPGPLQSGAAPSEPTRLGIGLGLGSIGGPLQLPNGGAPPPGIHTGRPLLAPPPGLHYGPGPRTGQPSQQQPHHHHTAQRPQQQQQHGPAPPVGSEPRRQQPQQPHQRQQHQQHPHQPQRGQQQQAPRPHPPGRVGAAGAPTVPPPPPPAFAPGGMELVQRAPEPWNSRESERDFGPEAKAQRAAERRRQAESRSHKASEAPSG